MRITVDTRDLRKLERDLKKVAAKAFPYAVKDALNSTAFTARQEWQSGIKKKFTLRNDFTVRSVRVDKAQGLNLSRMQAVVGSVAPYMGDQEEGATVKGGGKHKAIPAPAAAGHRPGSGIRTRLVRPKYKLSSVSVAGTPGGGYGKRRRNAVAIAVAMRKGQKFVLLNRIKGKGRGLFEITGAKKLARTKMLWDMSRGSVQVKPTHTLESAVTFTGKRMPNIMSEALRRQLKRHRVIGF
jgi:hypothetical protein